MTSVLIARLVDRGLISWDSTLGYHRPTSPVVPTLQTRHEANLRKSPVGPTDRPDQDQKKAENPDCRLASCIRQVKCILAQN
jgi:CubicO group peptidase (beta-lactamase class C family)